MRDTPNTFANMCDDFDSLKKETNPIFSFCAFVDESKGFKSIVMDETFYLLLDLVEDPDGTLLIPNKVWSC